MSWESALTIYGIVLVALLVGGVAIGSVMGIVGALGVTLLSGMDLWPTLGDIVWNTSNSFTLVAVPLFVLMGEIIVRSGVSVSFYAGLSQLLYGVRGGLAHSNIAGCAMFAAISGSSTATALTIGTVAIPEMRKRGYDDKLTLGTLAAGGCLGILIPPSIPMIIYAAVVQASVLDLFMAGVVPGVLLALIFMAYVAVYVWMKPSVAPAPAPRPSLRQVGKSLLGTVPIILLITVILGGMYAGVVTPTEAAAFGCVVALIIAAFNGGLSLRNLRDALRNAVVTNAVLMFVIINAQILTYALTTSGVGRGASQLLVSLGLGPLGFFSALVVLYLILGTFIDGISMMLLTIPLLYPSVIANGFDPVLFGVILVVLIELGQLTPPMGLNLFAIQSISNGVALGHVARASAPFAALIILYCFLLFFFPGLALWLPAYMKA